MPLLLLVPLAAVAPAGAQDNDREILLPEDTDTVPEMDDDIDEMVILPTGRADFLKDMSISATSFSAAEIKSLRIQNIADLADYTPNLEINTRSAASNPTLFIRGIGLKDYNANAAGAVAVYQDGININSPAIQLGQLFDTEEISVLRGPQGSVNGRNATAGAIMINSVLPDGELDASGSFTYGNYNNIQAEGAVAFPLVEDLLSTRMAFTANFRDGTVKNHCADWDPESLPEPKPVLTEATTRLAWERNGEPNHVKGALTGNYQGMDHVEGHTGLGRRDTWTPASDDHFHLKGGRYPTVGNVIPGQLDEQGRSLTPDEVCIWKRPGNLFFDANGQEDWIPTDFVQTHADFQGLKRNVNDVDNWAVRMILRLQPDVDDGMDWILNAHGGQNLADSARLQSIHTKFVLNAGDPFFTENHERANELDAARISGLEGTRVVDGLSPPRTSADNIVSGGLSGSDVDAGFYDSDGLERLDTWGLGLRGLWDTGSVKLTSLTGYEWYERKIDDEGDAVPIRISPAIYEDSAWQVSQELRVEGEGEGYRWSVGGFFLYEDLDSSNLFPGILSRRIEQNFTQELMSGAGYANGRYWLLDEVYFDAGLRYNVERKEFTLESTITVLAGNNFRAIPEETIAKTWDTLTGEAILGWQPSGDWMYDARLDFANVYLKFGRGMKGGHFNAGLTIQGTALKPQRIDPVPKEILHSLEAGIKSRWLQNRLILSLAVFHYWYEDLQVFDFTNEAGELPLQKLLSSDARVLGAEVEIQARPLPGLLIQFGGGWLDSEFKDFFVEKAVLGRRGGGTPTTPFDYSGNPLISAPEWSVSGVVEYQISLWNLGSVVPQYDFSYRSKVYLDPQQQEVISQDPYWQHNARLAYRTPDGRFEIAGWVENFLDKRYKIDVFDLSIATDTILEVWNDPRMYGVTVSAYW